MHTADVQHMKKCDTQNKLRSYDWPGKTGLVN